MGSLFLLGLRALGEIYFNNVAHLASYWMSDFMSSQVASFEDLNISINLTETKTDFLERILRYALKMEIPPQKPLFTISKDSGERKLYAYTSTEYASSEYISQEEQLAERLPPEVIKERLVDTVFVALHRALYPNAFTLPTERTTFITLSFANRGAERGPISIKEMSLQEESEEQGGKAMIGPVNIFLAMMDEIFDRQKKRKGQREREAKNNPKIKEYIALAKLLEKQIIGGEIKYTQSD
jgi:hypothetical protein